MRFEDPIMGISGEAARGLIESSSMGQFQTILTQFN